MIEKYWRNKKNFFFFFFNFWGEEDGSWNSGNKPKYFAYVAAPVGNPEETSCLEM